MVLSVYLTVLLGRMGKFCLFVFRWNGLEQKLNWRISFPNQIMQEKKVFGESEQQSTPSSS